MPQLGGSGSCGLRAGRSERPWVSLWLRGVPGLAWFELQVSAKGGEASMRGPNVGQTWKEAVRVERLSADIKQTR